MQNEQIQEVKRAKKNSALSKFSNRNYGMCKCTIGSERIAKILIICHNIIIKNQYFLIRWVKTLDIMIEKGKGPMLGKLRTIKLIEVDV